MVGYPQHVFMKTVELFCGTKSFSKYAEKLGYETFTVDILDKFKPDLVHDLLESFPQILKEKIAQADIIWMSPPCQVFSMSSRKVYWTRSRKPRYEKAVKGLQMLKLCENIGNYCIKEGKIFFIENPMARARWFLPLAWRKHIWYCQYGEKRAKPTDIWTNLFAWKAKRCHNNNPNCNHIRSPRRDHTGGTQGLANEIERGRIPEQLFVEIFEAIQYKDQVIQKTIFCDYDTKKPKK